MSQKTEVLDALRGGPVCSFSFYNDITLTHRLAARIYDLRADGHTLTATVCHVHDHDSRAVRYTLSEELVLF